MSSFQLNPRCWSIYFIPGNSCQNTWLSFYWLKIAEISEFLPVFFPKSRILELDSVIEILFIPQNHIVGGYASPLFKWQADWRIFQYRSLAFGGGLGGYPVVGGFPGKHVMPRC